jgi:hypothetical protein
VIHVPAFRRDRGLSGVGVAFLKLAIFLVVVFVCVLIAFRKPNKIYVLV